MATIKTRAVKLKFTGPLHMGAGKNDNYDHSGDLIRSDTIKSALYAACRNLFPEDFPDDFDLSFFKKFKVSSAFPYFGDELFLPRPLSGINVAFSDLAKNEDSKLSKRIKKIRFIATSIYEKIAAGQHLSFTEDYFDLSKQILFSRPSEKAPKILEKEIRQRVYVPRPGETNQDSVPYFIEIIHFHPRAGLWFMLEVDDNAFFNKLEAGLRILGDSGFGTDKSVGNGQFQQSISEISLNVPDKPEGKMLISLFCPPQEAIQTEYLKKSAFLTEKRSGYIVSAQNIRFRHFRRKSIYMFAEGSIFPASMPDVGKVVDLKPETLEQMHPVWRDGTAIFLPFNNL
jgi:CRISPR type III-A-associated RAMP protein Csm4